jgi:hypothetical protein
MTTLRTCKDSAPGPDGISYSHLAAVWPTMGKLITDAWKYSLETKHLPISHRTSFLKLIPKAGKNQKDLANWRPITLSNCDHKLITKLYCTRIADKIKDKICGNQTAYLKGRVISDNIRFLIAAIETINNDDEVDALLISLDAKKAFDSVEHSYIEKCLSKLGLKKFIPIFNILYSDLRTDILINGKIVKGFRINRGVKQGDSLSCILFIICMEPLIRNIESNPDIKPIWSRDLGCNLPKVAAYADDVNSLTQNDPESLTNVFKEYERLTKLSGLELNANKTEILRIKAGQCPPPKCSFRISYLTKRYTLETCDKTKINGIVFQQDFRKMQEENVALAIKKMESHFKSWSRRGLTTLGKILIAKTFGISNIVFLMQAMTLTDSEFKLVNAALYKFIWNRHYQAAKAPERIKRDILNKPIKFGGYGMLDIAELDKSLKLRSLGRLSTSKHPFLKLIRNKLDFADYLNPVIRTKIDRVTSEAVKLLRKDRKAQIDFVEDNPKILTMLRSTRVKNLLTYQGMRSIVYFNLHRQNKKLIGNLTLEELRTLEPIIIDKDLINILRKSISYILPSTVLSDRDSFLFPIRNRLKDIATLTSKQIRTARSAYDPECVFKIGTILDPLDSINWLRTLNSLTSTRHKNNLLKVIHGDVYSRNRKFKFGLIQDPNCERCGQVDTIQHKLFECPLVEQVWRKMFVLTNKILPVLPTCDLIDRALGAFRNCSREVLTIQAELLTRLLYLRSTDAIPPPDNFVDAILRAVLRNETKSQEEFKNNITSLLRD